MNKKNPKFSFLPRMLIALGAAMIIVTAAILANSDSAMVKVGGVVGILFGAGMIMGSNLIRNYHQKLMIGWFIIAISFVFTAFGLLGGPVFSLGAGFSLIGALIGLAD